MYESMLTINEERSGLSVGFFFKHLSTKSLILSEKILLGNFGAGWLTIYSNNSKMAIGLVPGDRGVRGVFGCGEIKLSSKTWGPKSCTWVDVSGGGIGYIPKLISNNDSPSDHKSLATEYCDPWKKKIKIKNLVGKGIKYVYASNALNSIESKCMIYIN